MLKIYLNKNITEKILIPQKIELEEKSIYDSSSFKDIVSFSVYNIKDTISKIVNKKNFNFESVYTNEDLFSNAIVESFSLFGKIDKNEIPLYALKTESCSLLILNYIKFIIYKNAMYTISDNICSIPEKYKDNITTILRKKINYFIDALEVVVNTESGKDIVKFYSFYKFNLITNRYNKFIIPILFNPYCLKDKYVDVTDYYNYHICKNEDISFYISCLEKADKKEYTAIDFIIRRLFGYGIDELERFCY